VTEPEAASRPLRSRDPRLGPWRAFLAAHARVWRRLDEDLRAEHALSLPEYEALLLLAQAADRRLRMRALAEALQLSKSGATRLVDRLVADGLVERCQCPTDARGAEALLTTIGLDRLRTAAPTHLRGIQAYFLSAISERDLATVEAAMLGIAERLPGTGLGRGLPAADRSPDPGAGAAPHSTAGRHADDPSGAARRTVG
jgi:DNA-binding MarR family transcriptional regulator